MKMRSPPADIETGCVSRAPADCVNTPAALVNTTRKNNHEISR